MILICTTISVKAQVGFCFFVCRFATQWPNLKVLKGVWSDYYTSYRRLQAKVTHLKVKVSELNTPPVTTKIIASQKVIMKVGYHVTVMWLSCDINMTITWESRVSVDVLIPIPGNFIGKQSLSWVCRHCSRKVACLNRADGASTSARRHAVREGRGIGAGGWRIGRSHKSKVSDPLALEVLPTDLSHAWCTGTLTLSVSMNIISANCECCHTGEKSCKAVNKCLFFISVHICT